MDGSAKEDLDTVENNGALDRIREVIKKEFSLVRFILIRQDV